MLSTLSPHRLIAVQGEAKRHKVTVTLTAHFLAERAGEGLFPWEYDGEIENGSDETIVVDRRTWLIQNGVGASQKQRVHGLTITGDRPIIAPGKCAYFRTGVPLNYDTGWMEGTLHCRVLRTGKQFDIIIPRFPLNKSNPGVALRPRLRWAEATSELVVTPGQARTVRERLDRFANAAVDTLSTHTFPPAIRYVVEDFLLREHLHNEIKDFVPLAQLNTRYPLLGCLIDLRTSDLYITALIEKYGIYEYGVELIKFGRNPKEVDEYFAARAG